MTAITTEPAFILHRGTHPLLVSIPHMGTYLPPAIAARLSPAALALPDTDWHLDRLYGFARELGASVLMATHSRYMVDLNRPPDDQSLYPGQDTTGLCPVDTFDKQPLYAEGDLPDAAEIAARREAVWRPYHEALQQELARLREQHGAAALWDAHSIRSVLPRFFAGRLPDLNLGTADGASCDPALAQAVHAIAQSAPGFSALLNGRFKGGYITRQYGRPEAGVQAIQLEMTLSSYMEEAPPFAWDAARAAGVQPHLRAMLDAVLGFVERG